MTAPAIEVAGLVIRYGDLVAVDGIGFEVGAGQVVTLLGRNGAGKTSTVECLEGYRRPAAGSVRVLGLDPYREAEHRRLTTRIGVMLQRGGVYPSMGPGEALRLFASYYDDPRPPAELLDRLALREVEATPWRRLSGGEQQRLSLALALVGRPEAVFLDEPTAGVDPAGRITIREEVAALAGAGVAVLLTTHELEEAERLSDRILIVDRGRVVAAGTPGELAAAGPDGEVLRFSARTGLPVAELAGALGRPVSEPDAGHYRVDGPPSPALVADLTAWLAERNTGLTDMRTGSRLEDVFIHLTGGPAAEPAPTGPASGSGAGRARRRRARR